MRFRRFAAASLCLVALASVPACSDRGVQKAAGFGNTVRLKWTKSTDPDVLGYRIYQSTQPNFALDGLDYLSTGPNATSIVIPSLSKGKHYFKIISVGTLPAVNGKGGQSAAVQVAIDVP